MWNDEPDSGEITIGESVNMISVGQDCMDELSSDKTVFEEISEKTMNLVRQTIVYGDQYLPKI